MRAFIPLLLLLGACATTPAGSSGGVETVLSLQGLDCRDCAAKAAERLREEPGVREVIFDEAKVELYVIHEPGRPAPERLAQVAHEADEEWKVVLGAGYGSWVTRVKFPPNADVQWISKAGEDVEVAAHLAPGKVTVLDFYADWCGPCREVDLEMMEILEKHTGVALRKINIVDWDSPVTKHYMADVATLPYLVVHGKDGRRVATIAGLDLPALRSAVEEAAR